MAIKVLDGLLAQRRRQGLLMASGVLHHEGPSFPASLALLWQGKLLTFHGKYLIWRP